MGIDKLKKKPNQLVSKRKDDKRPGYRGSDWGGSSYSGYDSPSSDSSDDNRENYISQQYTAPAPTPEPDTSGDDQEEDVATMMETLGITPDNAPTGFAPTTGEDGYGEGDYDDGGSLYKSRTLTMKEQEPYINYKPGPNYVTADELSRLNRGIGDYDEQAATLAKIQAVNPIEKQGFFDSGIGSVLKTAGAIAAPFVAAPIAGLVGGKTAFDAVNLYNRANFFSKQATKFGLTDKTLPTLTELAKNIPQGTGNRRPDTATGYESDGDNRPIPKDVIAANIQKFSPSQINSLQSNIAFLGSVLEAREYKETQLNKSQLSQISNQRDLLIEQYNMIQKMQADPPKTMVT